MRQGTTPTHYYTLPIDVSTIRKVEITYAQGGKVILTKGNADVSMEGKTIAVDLTQEDTFKLSAAALVNVQVRVMTTDDTVLASRVMTISCFESLSKEVLT